MNDTRTASHRCGCMRQVVDNPSLGHHPHGNGGQGAISSSPPPPPLPPSRFFSLCKEASTSHLQPPAVRSLPTFFDYIVHPHASFQSPAFSALCIPQSQTPCHPFTPPRNPQDPIGVPRSKENAPPQNPTVGLCPGPYGGPRGGGGFL